MLQLLHQLWRRIHLAVPFLPCLLTVLSGRRLQHGPLQKQKPAGAALHMQTQMPALMRGNLPLPHHDQQQEQLRAHQLGPPALVHGACFHPSLLLLLHQQRSRAIQLQQGSRSLCTVEKAAGQTVKTAARWRRAHIG